MKLFLIVILMTLLGCNTNLYRTTVVITGEGNVVETFQEIGGVSDEGLSNSRK